MKTKDQSKKQYWILKSGLFAISGDSDKLPEEFVEDYPLHYFYGELAVGEDHLTKLGFEKNIEIMKSRLFSGIYDDQVDVEEPQSTQFYFAILDNVHGDSSSPCVVIVEKAFWNEYNHLQDNHQTIQLPQGFMQFQESYFSIPFHSVLRAIEKLDKLGFERNLEIEKKWNSKNREWTW